MINKKMYEDLAFFTVCNSAGSLGKFFNDVVSVSNVKTEVVKSEELKKKGDIYSKILFNAGDIGQIYVILNDIDGLELAKYGIEKKLNKEAKDEWDEFNINVVEEMVNILAGNMTEILSVIRNVEVEIEAPELYFEWEETLGEDEYIVSTFVIRLGADKKIFIKEAAKKEFYEKLIDDLKIRI